MMRKDRPSSLYQEEESQWGKLWQTGHHLPHISLNYTIGYVNVFAEVIENSSKWSHIKEGHIRSENCIKHTIVQLFSSSKDALCERVPASGVEYALTHSDRACQLIAID